MFKIQRNIEQFTYDIEECITEIKEEIFEKSYEEFLNDKKSIAYIERMLEKIGEAVTQIQKLNSEILLNSFSDVSYWENIKGMRNKIIHEYWGTSVELLYEVSLYEMDDLLEYIYKIRKNIKNYK